MASKVRIWLAVVVFLLLSTLSHAETGLQKFESIEIEFNVDQVKGKLLLVCFWDMQQRPSRNMIMELSKRKKELEEKNVEVLLINTSDIEVEELNKWIAENKITFTSGRVVKDTRMVLYRWGVRAQPWLVLTDDNAKIRVGGFELEQLDAAIQGKSFTESSNRQSGEIILKLIDSEGMPVGGARVGSHVNTRDETVLNNNLSWSLRDHETNISNDWGEVTLFLEKLFLSSWSEDRRMGLYILHEERKIGAICEITRNDKPQIIELTLEPVCRVYGKLNSEGLNKVGRPLTWSNVYIYWDKDCFGVLSHSSNEQRFEFYVPPGKYELKAYGSGEGTSTKSNKSKIIVKPSQAELDMGTIELPATKLSTMIGKPTPEIGPVKAWKNGPPVKLTDLRGKLVILCFGGGYPSTSRDLPGLVELHEEFEDKGLVIIALYNCESMEQLEQRFISNFEEFGGEAKVPFRIAVDGGEGRPIDSIDRTIPGATYATYDISFYSTTVLIDREGKIVEELKIYQARKKIEALCGITNEPELSAWRRRFDKVYFLEDNQVLKRIAPPFIPERAEYYENTDVGITPRNESPPDYFDFYWDGQIRRKGAGYGGESRPLKLILRRTLNIKQNEFEGPEELLEIGMPGDWIVRNNIATEDKLRALERILKNEIGRDIRFVKRTVECETIIAEGAFKYHPLPSVPDERRVLMFAGDFIERGGGGASANSVHSFVECIGNEVNMPIVDDTASAKRIRIPFKFDRSIRIGKIVDPAEKEKKLTKLLDNISRQTNLKFRVEQRPIEKWFITEVIRK